MRRTTTRPARRRRTPVFDQFKAMGALAGLMKNREKIREAGERMQASLEAARIVGQAGGGGGVH